MLAVVLGSPCRPTFALVDAIRTTLARALGSLDYFHFSTAERLREDWSSRTSRHLMLFCDYPDLAAAEMLRKIGASTVFVALDPERVAWDRRIQSGDDAAAAIRATSASCAALHDVVRTADNLLRLDLTTIRSSRDLVARVADFYALPVGEAEIAGIAATIAEDAAEAVRGLVAGGRMDPEFVGLARTLSPYRLDRDLRPADGFFWPPELFFGVEPLGAPLLGKVELTGPARIVVYGPYMHLPPGRWRASARFAVADNASGNRLQTEWVIGAELVSAAESKLPAAGEFEFDTEVDIIEPRDPVQLRFSILEGAIEGSFELLGVGLRRIDQARRSTMPAA